MKSFAASNSPRVCADHIKGPWTEDKRYWSRERLDGTRGAHRALELRHVWWLALEATFKNVARGRYNLVLRCSRGTVDTLAMDAIIAQRVESQVCARETTVLAIPGNGNAWVVVPICAVIVDDDITTVEGGVRDMLSSGVAGDNNQAIII
ncbi:g793 [Coccomyxa elongata]